MLKNVISAGALLAAVLGVFCGTTLSVASAQDEAPAKKLPPGVQQPFNVLNSIKLSDEQGQKLEALKKEAVPKLTAAVKKVEDIYTKDQKKQRKEITDKAKADGKKGKELKAAVQEGLNLSADQKESLTKAEQELSDLQKATREQAIALLTDEQKASLPTPGKKKKNK